MATPPLLQLDGTHLGRHRRRRQSDWPIAYPLERGTSRFRTTGLVGKEDDREHGEGEVVLLRLKCPALAVSEAAELLAVSEKSMFDAPTMAVEAVDPATAPVRVRADEEPQRPIVFQAAGDHAHVAPAGQVGLEAPVEADEASRGVR